MTGSEANFEYRVFWECGARNGYSAWEEAPDGVTTADGMHEWLQGTVDSIGLETAINLAGFGWTFDFRESEDQDA